MQPSGSGARRNSSRWGLAVLLLAKCAVSTHAEVTLWHQRETFKGYYQRKFHSRGAKDALHSFGNQRGVAACEADAPSEAPARPLRAQSEKSRFNLLSQFSRLSKRIPSSAVDCCAQCHDCLSTKALAECDRRNNLLAVPRGGHSTASATLSAAADALPLGAAEALSAVTPYGLPLYMWKIIFQVVLTTMNVACWLIPLKSKRITDNKLGLSLANAFSGGVFLSLAFGHLIPECVQGFNGVGHEINEALPYMVVLGGYLLIFFVEKVAFDAHEILHEMESGGGQGVSSSTPGKGGVSHSPKPKASENGSAVVTPKDASSAGSGRVTGRSAVILLGALAVHSILEMTALGLADTFGDSALLSLSIALHQPAESIALLVAFLKSGMPKPEIIKFLSVFSCMGPIGVAIGMAVNNFASPVVDATMLAVVAGTFVYVGATEVIPEEWEDPEHKWKKFIALISGIVSIFAITQYTTGLEQGL